MQSRVLLRRGEGRRVGRRDRGRVYSNDVKYALRDTQRRETFEAGNRYVAEERACAAFVSGIWKNRQMLAMFLMYAKKSRFCYCSLLVEKQVDGCSFM